MEGRLNEQTEQGWVNAADSFRESNMKYGTAELKVLAVVELQTDIVTATSVSATYGELMDTHNVITG